MLGAISIYGRMKSYFLEPGHKRKFIFGLSYDINRAVAEHHVKNWIFSTYKSWLFSRCVSREKYR